MVAAVRARVARAAVEKVMVAAMATVVASRVAVAVTMVAQSVAQLGAVVTGQPDGG